MNKRTITKPVGEKITTYPNGLQVNAEGLVVRLPRPNKTVAMPKGL